MGSCRTNPYIQAALAGSAGADTAPAGQGAWISQCPCKGTAAPGTESSFSFRRPSPQANVSKSTLYSPRRQTFYPSCTRCGKGGLRRGFAPSPAHDSTVKAFAQQVPSRPPYSGILDVVGLRNRYEASLVNALRQELEPQTPSWAPLLFAVCIVFAGAGA